MQPWYAVPLVALAVVAVRPEWALVAAAAYPYFFAVILDAPHTVAIGRLSYGLAWPPWWRRYGVGAAGPRPCGGPKRTKT